LSILFCVNDLAENEDCCRLQAQAASLEIFNHRRDTVACQLSACSPDDDRISSSIAPCSVMAAADLHLNTSDIGSYEIRLRDSPAIHIAFLPTVGAKARAIASNWEWDCEIWQERDLTAQVKSFRRPNS